MVKVTKIYPIGFAANSYLVTADGKTAVMIDAAQEAVIEDVMDSGLKVTHVLLTHGHFDHIGGALRMRAAGAAIGCHKLEEDIILHHNLSEEFGTSVRTFTPDFTFGEETLHIGGMDIKVLFTPGHTTGSVCFIIEDNLFTGDTLFAGNAGRTDFATGNSTDMKKSLKKIAALDGDYKIFAGHDNDSTLSFERKHNYFLR